MHPERPQGEETRTRTVCVRGVLVGVRRRCSSLPAAAIDGVPGARDPPAHRPPCAPAGDGPRLAAAAALPAVLLGGARRLLQLLGRLPPALAQKHCSPAAWRLTAGAQLDVRCVVLAAGCGCQRRPLLRDLRHQGAHVSFGACLL